MDFQKVGFALAVRPEKRLVPPERKNLQFLDIAILEETQPCELHA